MKYVFTLLLATLVLAGCATDEPTVAILAPTTGDFAAFGNEIVEATIAGLGEGVNYIIEDTQCEPAPAISAYRKVIDINQVDLVVGPACGSPQTVVAEAAREDNTVILLPSAAAEGLYELSEENVYNFQYSLESEGQYMAEVLDQQYERVVIVSYQNDFSKVLNDATVAALNQEPFEIIVEEFGPTDAQKIKDFNPDALYAVDLSFFIQDGHNTLREIGVDVPMYANYAASMQGFEEVVQDAQFPYPVDIASDTGIVYSMSFETGQYARSLIEQCQKDTACMKELLAQDQSFVEGSRVRELELRSHE